MKLLKIENNLGYFLNNHGEFDAMDKVTKEDLLRLVKLTLEEEVEFDEYNDEALKNQSHQIIYKSIFEKLLKLRDRKEEFIDKSERLYLQEYERYRDKPSEQGA